MEDHKSDISVFPNSVKDVIRIESAQTINDVRLIDVSGMTVAEYHEIEKITFDLDASGAKNGVYILEVLAVF